MTLFDFNIKSDSSNWNIVDDVVMGGRSSSSFGLTKEGNGLFKGMVSLENNGGFAMVQLTLDTLQIEGLSKAIITLKGDGKTYQFRIKTSIKDAFSFIASFKTTGDWQTTEIPFTSMYPAFRGKKLDTGNYSSNQLEQIAFLIGNKKAESFRLEIKSIALK